MNYIIIEAIGTKLLAEKVNEAMLCGFCPIGGPFYVHGGERGDFWYGQAMIKKPV